jgi:hypothetical protein
MKRVASPYNAISITLTPLICDPFDLPLIALIVDPFDFQTDPPAKTSPASDHKSARSYGCIELMIHSERLPLQPQFSTRLRQEKADTSR